MICTLRLLHGILRLRPEADFPGVMYAVILRTGQLPSFSSSLFLLACSRLASFTQSLIWFQLHLHVLEPLLRPPSSSFSCSLQSATVFQDDTSHRYTQGSLALHTTLSFFQQPPCHPPHVRNDRRYDPNIQPQTAPHRPRHRMGRLHSPFLPLFLNPSQIRCQSDLPHHLVLFHSSLGPSFVCDARFQKRHRTHPQQQMDGVSSRLVRHD